MHYLPIQAILSFVVLCFITEETSQRVLRARTGENCIFLRGRRLSAIGCLQGQIKQPDEKVDRVRS